MVKAKAANNRLTSREKEVLAMIAEGQSNKEMANHLGVRGPHDQRLIARRVMDKLSIHTVAGLTEIRDHERDCRKLEVRS